MSFQKGLSVSIIFGLFSLGLALLLLFTPTFTNAQGLVQLAECSGPDCGTCQVLKLTNGLIMWLIAFVFLLFAVLLMRAGVLLVTSNGNPGALQGAKDNFINALIGLVIILASWLIVDTIMRALVGPVGNEGQLKLVTAQRTGYLLWSEITCTAQVSPKECTEAKGCVGIVTLDAIAHEIEDDGSSVGSGANCPAASESSVTTIPGTEKKARSDIVNQFVAMRNAAASAGISLQVTSGWRSEAEQVSLWNRYCPNGTCGRLAVGKPCSLGGNGSNHNSGVAIDINVGCGNGQTGCNTTTYNWLKANGSRFGFYNNLPNDPLHWSPSGR